MRGMTEDGTRRTRTHSHSSSWREASSERVWGSTDHSFTGDPPRGRGCCCGCCGGSGHVRHYGIVTVQHVLPKDLSSKLDMLISLLKEEHDANGATSTDEI